MFYLLSGEAMPYSIYYIYILNIALFLVILVLTIFLNDTLKKKRKLIQTHAQREIDLAAEHRKDKEAAIETSKNSQRNVLKGQIVEDLFPFMRQSPFLPADMRFLGSPIDYIVFDGYGEAKDNKGEIKEVIFSDIKYGNAKLLGHQKKIKEAIQAGRVGWVTIRVKEDMSIVFERD